MTKTELKSPRSKESENFAFLTPSKKSRGLSEPELQQLLETIQKGERNHSRSFISRSLNVNDVVAELCLRHLEDKLKREQGCREIVLQQASALPGADASGQQRFLRDVFGVQGIVSKAILNHWRSTGA